ncbi:hypothetical protein PSYRMG_15390 [Pseudomonas syringae UMAF0158]|nr:hypothetical protein PSYRMG_15390 [Pseudomonas syringae UMAF0158]
MITKNAHYRLRVAIVDLEALPVTTSIYQSHMIMQKISA